MDSTPVFGLPKAVAVMLDTLLQENKLTSWHVNGGNGNVTLKLKFSSSHNGQSFKQTYRSKPPSALARDQARKELFMKSKSVQSESGFCESFINNSDKDLDNSSQCNSVTVENTIQPLSRTSKHATSLDPTVTSFYPNGAGQLQAQDNSPVSCVLTEGNTHRHVNSTPNEANSRRSADHVNIPEDCDVCHDHEQHSNIYDSLHNQVIEENCSDCTGVLFSTCDENWEQDIVRPVFKCPKCGNVLCKRCVLSLNHSCDCNIVRKQMKLVWSEESVAVAFV